MTGLVRIWWRSPLGPIVDLSLVLTTDPDAFERQVDEGNFALPGVLMLREDEVPVALRAALRHSRPYFLLRDVQALDDGARVLLSAAQLRFEALPCS